MSEVFTQYGIPLISFLVGFMLGLLTQHHLCKKDKNLFKANESLAWFFAIVWLGLHIYGLVTGKFKLPWIFDVLGGLTIGHVIGFDIKDIINAIRGEKQ